MSRGGLCRVSCSARGSRAQGDFGLERVKRFTVNSGAVHQKIRLLSVAIILRSAAAEWEQSMNSKERGHGHSYRSQLVLASHPQRSLVSALPWSFHFPRSSRRDDILASRAFNGATEHMIYREGVATNENDAPTFRPFYCSCQQHAFFLIRIRAFPTGCSPRRSSRPSHLGPRAGGCDVGWNRFLVGGRQQQPGCN